jgi:hypothetical protein
LTPAEELPSHPNKLGALPHSLPYSEAFENGLMHAILDPSHLQPATSIPIHEESPQIPASQLPTPLDSPLRVYPSRFPGLRLTHCHGYHTGGPGPSPETAANFAESFIAAKSIKRPEELKRKIDDAIEERAREVIERMERRKAALKKNEDQRKLIASLEASRRAEERVEEKLRAEREEKRAKG